MLKTTPQWLSSAVFYEIYPQSFYDSNADGIGDLPGIIQKLDYVQSLGCNAVWLNPCFVSPFNDAGYDVADYYKVAPRYGTNADLKRLFKAAQKRGIRICLDLVAGHTSIEHPWFRQSCRHQKNKYSNWYIWNDNWWAEPPPDLRMVNGFAQRDGSFVTNFFWSQPALNFGFAKPDPAQPWQLPTDHPDVKALRREIVKVMRFWLDMGAAGFRVDMASSLVKGDKNAKLTSLFWQEVRALFDRKYPQAALISEWSYPSEAIKAGFHMDHMLGFRSPDYRSLFRHESSTNVPPEAAHSFFLRTGKGNIRTFLDSYLSHYRKTKRHGYISLLSGDHDFPRISLGRSQKELELVFAFLLTMPGVPFIYYGDEIGMKYLNLTSKEGGYNRTGARTPMQWDSTKNAGFSQAKASELYLPIDPAQSRPNVQAQDARSNSLLNKVRALVALRRRTPALCGDGNFEVVYARPRKYPFVYLRRLGRERFLIALNPSAQPVSISLSLPASKRPPALQFGRGTTLTPQAQRPKLTMAGVSYAIYRL